MGAKNASGGANADRARENQRRSRARKREYIASLEERLRRYHEAGVKANIGLQEAAQRVLNENRDLRKLLNELGLRDQDIQAKLEMLRRTDGGAPCAELARSKSCACAVDSSKPESADSFEGLLTDEVETGTSSLHGAGYPDQTGAIPAPPDADFLWDLASETNSSCTAPSPPALLPHKYTTPLSEMDLCCSLFLPRATAPSGIDGDPFLPQSVPDKSLSTPCTVAYTVLTTLNARIHQQQDMLLITLELLNGLRDAPEGDPEGCRVDNDVLIPVMGKLLAG